MEKYNFTTIRVNIRPDQVAELMFNRPKANAFDPIMMRELIQAYELLGEDKNVKSVLLYSDNAKFFSTGIDINSLYDALGNETKNKEIAGLVVDMFNAQRAFAKPMIIAVDQMAHGGGVEFIAAANDRTYVIVGSKAKIAFPRKSLGILPSAAMPDLIRKIGPNKAMRLFSGFDTPDNTSLVQLGLADEYVPNAKQRAEEILESGVFPVVKRKSPTAETANYDGIPEPIASLATKVLEIIDDKPVLDAFIAGHIAAACQSEAGQKGIAEFVLGEDLRGLR